MERVKYPRTWHLPDSPNRGADGDHAYADYGSFEGREVVVTEKLDGENTSIYADGYTHARSVSSGYHQTRTWVRALAGRIAHALPDGWRVCGENTYGRHSIAYDALPSYFQLFAVYDADDVCLSWDDTAAWAHRLGVDLVPLLFRGEFDRVRVLSLLGGASAYGPEREGVVVRWASAFGRDEHLGAVGKLVRADHVKTDQHWMSGAVVPNGLAS
ncbi:RNA ligase family protein [Solirubrobacter sp. CPCC 204708]|uniref:RNA ligase family protein n=1 Tax=Solirubrobacter deserti TaxID=2282478 RepID=A0ABT4RFA1_9ACTN|nr:RNA ligase family protein [Solirubrobacter deserti]MBE2319520.1 RNA ligase family protein [Solirubrobacter deserti]MDA0137193.1 RNA ligase family protein [Solirubrobacter deserti]